MTTDVAVDTVMAEIQARVRDRVREDLLRHGASPQLGDAEIFAHVESILRSAVGGAGPRVLLLPELLGDPEVWRLDTAMRYRSHRGRAGGLIIFVKRRLLMPVLRWLFEYSQDNFERQRRMNEILCACVQELAIETARLRRDLHRLGR